MQTNDRAEYEASFVVEALRDKVGDRDLRAILRESLSLREPTNDGADAKPQPDERVLEVIDTATGVISKLVDFVLELLAGSTGPAPRDARDDMRPFSRDPAARRRQRHARIAAERAAEAARRSIERMREDMEAGRKLKADDIRGLTRAQKEQIASLGDAAVREMVTDARKRDDRHWQGDERER